MLIVGISEPKDEETLVRPLALGVEAVGVVEKLGKKISNDLQIGDRVGYCIAPTWPYCEKRVIHQKYLIKIQDEIPDEIVPTVLLKSMIAHYLINQSYKIKPGTVVLVRGVNGGLGQIICQWANDKK
ncbi:alcohol dehydrogenase catalytic domain-containing protein [Wolbachia endosymbiont of Onchocerca gibsoni]|uniref:alcohol dehydrogenase catalytic domain-containing protein n=1 Tax=Wolbachia endosymbiont of Onchocerca gibsoni TaxID=118986 RepID=UPI0023D82B61|nr:alcohol dehydrogenase catalytic domain-containing protein [Wolbachia endosymbiont of Onchocerca gibsoni]